MITNLTCPHCNREVEISQALTHDIERKIVASQTGKHQAELERVRAEATEKAAAEARSQLEFKMKQSQAEADAAKSEKLQLREQLLSQADALRRAKAAEESAEAQMQQRLAELSVQLKAQGRAEAETAVRQELELSLTSQAREVQAEKDESKKLRDQLSQLMTRLGEAQRAKENAELEAKQKLAQEEAGIRELATREADERQRLNLAAKEKTITDLQRSLDEAQRRAAQGSQQLQGEIMELDLETTLAEAFRDDEIEPVAKGTRGGDIKHIVKSPRGAICGIMIWEFKRTKNWTDGWIPKLKEDVRASKASVPIIVSEVLPKSVGEHMGLVEGVWVCQPALAIMLGTLLRKSLLDVSRQRVLDSNRLTNAEALYNFVTGHEFVQQVELMVETYREMLTQVSRERAAFEKLWAQREKQAQRLMTGTANMIGSMQGHIGPASMPRIKGLELLEAGEDDDV